MMPEPFIIHVEWRQVTRHRSVVGHRTLDGIYRRHEVYSITLHSDFLTPHAPRHSRHFSPFSREYRDARIRREHS